MAKFNEKRLKLHRQDALGNHRDLDGVRLSLLIAKLIELLKKHGDSAVFTVDVDDSDYGPCSGMTYVNMFVASDSLETDEEYNKRKELHAAFEKANRERYKQTRLRREEQDRKEFARLSKKFAK
jgi:hypothetical protein